MKHKFMSQNRTFFFFFSFLKFSYFLKLNEHIYIYKNITETLLKKQFYSSIYFISNFAGDAYAG